MTVYTVKVPGDQVEALANGSAGSIAIATDTPVQKGDSLKLEDMLADMHGLADLHVDRVLAPNIKGIAAGHLVIEVTPKWKADR